MLQHYEEDYEKKYDGYGYAGRYGFGGEPGFGDNGAANPVNPHPDADEFGELGCLTRRTPSMATARTCLAHP